jgi:Bacterial SH3 domain
MRRFLAAALALAVPILPAAAEKQDIRQERVQFSAGQKTSTTIRGTIRGDQIAEYFVEIPAGSKLAVSMQTSNSSSYFNISAPGADTAMYIGSTSGNSFVGSAPSSGDYTIRVYLMRNAARRDERARYMLNIQIAASAPAQRQQEPGTAEGPSSAPDGWRVVVSEGDVLNMRAAPSARSAIVARLPNGTTLKNAGCRVKGTTKWCQVTAPDGREGWVAGRYLRE